MQVTKMPLTVVLAAGDFPTHPAPLAALGVAAHVVCCDGAAERLLAYGREPDAVVGDMDSLSDALRERLGDRVVAVAEQDDNDLAKAFRHALSRGWRDIAILGATGRREDHTLANIAWLADFAPLADNVSMITDNGVFRAFLPPAASFRAAPGTQVSIFGFDPEDPVSASGLKFPVERLRLARWWTASLNEAVADTVELHFARGPLIVFTTHTGLTRP
jgi:thiamine pyrophosphokinase